METERINDEVGAYLLMGKAFLNDGFFITNQKTEALILEIDSQNMLIKVRIYAGKHISKTGWILPQHFVSER